MMAVKVTERICSVYRVGLSAPPSDHPAPPSSVCSVGILQQVGQEERHLAPHSIQQSGGTTKILGGEPLPPLLTFTHLSLL